MTRKFFQTVLLLLAWNGTGRMGPGMVAAPLPGVQYEFYSWKWAEEPVKQGARQAQAVLDGMMAKIPVDAYQQRYREVGPGFVKPWPAIATEEYDHFRRTLADWIIRLQTQMNGEDSTR